MDTLQLQQSLIALGFKPGEVDGAMGPRTRAAVRAFQAKYGLTVDGIPGPRTWAKIRELRPAETPADAGSTPPWVEEMARRKGLHENKNHTKLLAWLGSAGSAVDPAETPWCGDAVETAILRALPDAAVPVNPMASINWLKFGKKLEQPAYGAIMVFWRNDPNGWEGHVGFYVGEDANHYHVLGGNQSNAITITRIEKRRLRPKGIRWPNEYPDPVGGRLTANRNDTAVSHNEV